MGAGTLAGFRQVGAKPPAWQASDRLVGVHLAILSARYNTWRRVNTVTLDANPQLLSNPFVKKLQQPRGEGVHSLW